LLNLKKFVLGYTSVEEIFIADNTKAGDALEDFPDWILQELERRGWTQSELARRAEVTAATISTILSRQKSAGVDACLGIARAFGEPPVKMFRLAGLLPPLDTRKEVLDEALELFDQLSAADQARIIVIARAFALTAKERRKRGNPGPQAGAAATSD